MMLLPKLSACGLAVGLVLAAPAFAHDEILIKAVVENTGGDNAITIGHGCEDTHLPIRAQSVVFPTKNPELIASDGHTITDLSEIIGPSVYAGQVDTIQDRNIFNKQHEKHDKLGNAIGFYGMDGRLGTTLQGRVPFQFTAPGFAATSCATALKIEVAIADICDFTAPTIQAGKVNLWIPDNGSQYANLGGPQNIDGIGEPPIFQVTRNLTTNPLPNGCGAGFTVTVRPSAADVDAHLGIPGWHY
ncbi:hypothetical protein [Methylovulum psychrotolerans]|jgi:hypothetical protein|uniref:Spondin domain-containing protein n=1 Tax=Methylovulum psychrotolerans TaxID=1704499 RepID=A0A1Z4C438_9GAMM|nr:hypothetical protein [Methylovulum psychrotolerans]ASF48270.1 hypothetical protein CEK71_20610 [Methylovulum psychrotolerans]